VKAIVVYPDDPQLGEVEIDVPLAPVDRPENFEPESLYPQWLNIPAECPHCAGNHLVMFERKGFRLHDDGQIAVYHFIGVSNEETNTG
jgi:hypothetical protein